MAKLNITKKAELDEKRLESKKRAAHAECERRIYSRWSIEGQLSALDGVYGEQELADMRQWRDTHRAALHELLEREDLSDIDVTSDELWPAD